VDTEFENLQVGREVISQAKYVALHDISIFPDRTDKRSATLRRFSSGPTETVSLADQLYLSRLT
jgi:hypothetical protein